VFDRGSTQIVNLFIIPSWYPNHQHPLSGSFISEQLENFSELCPEIQVAVSVAGAGEFHLPFQHPIRSLRVLLNYIGAKPFVRKILPNLNEFHRPVLHWSPRFGANLSAIVEAHEKNLKAFMAEVGDALCIHAHVTFPAGWVAMILARKYGVPFMITEHSGPFPMGRGTFVHHGQLIDNLRMPLESADAIIAVSSALADRIQSFGVKRPIVVPNFVDERNFPCTPLPDKEPFTFLTVSSMLESKGIHDLLVAISLLARKGVETRHVLVGSGPDLKRFQTMAEQMKINDRIQWLGAVNRANLPKLFSESHAFVLPSHLETFGIVYAEAIASGRPVIATRCGGPESIVNSVNGILVGVNDPEALSEAMCRMIEGIDAYQPEEIHLDFMKRFSRQVVTKQLVDLYNQVQVRT